MNKIFYNKLVRDRIPEIIQEAGRQYEIETLSEDEYAMSLRQKLVEEAKESQKADVDDLITELADLYEVVDAIIAFYGLDRKQIETIQLERREKRGAFTKRIKLVWAEQ